MKRALLDSLLAARAAKRPVAVATELESGRQALISAEDSEGELPLNDDLLARIRRMIADDQSKVLGDEGIFVQTYSPPLRLFVIGAVHIAQALVPMASLTGYDVTVIDPRQAFATDSRFPEVELVDEWPDDALIEAGLDNRCAVVTLTHDPKLDDPALIEALKSDCFYIGSLGSKKTHASRLERLQDAGVEPALFSRIHGPIGLDIGAKSPAEIAIAVLGEMTAALRGGAAQSKSAA
ncbi:MAG: XdhC family protein [Rhodovibrionaceae bacterium]